MAQACAPPSWSERLADASRWPPFAGALALAGLLVALFLSLSFAVGRLPLVLSGEAPLVVREDLRVGIVLSLLAAYLPAAWVSAVRRARAAVGQLESVLRGPTSERAALVGAVGRYEPRALRRSGALGIGAAIVLQVFLDWGDRPVPPGLAFEPYWHRLMLAGIAWCSGRSVYGTIVESRRFSRIGRELVEVDLLDPGAVSALPRWGLHSALLGIGFLSLCSLLFYDLGAAPQLPYALPAIVLGGLSVASMGLLLPVRGLRQAIQQAKRRELAWCHEQIRRAREGERSAPQLSLADLVAYRSLVEAVREWPLDAPTLRRFALYLVLPLASWLGGALVERLVEAALG